MSEPRRVYDVLGVGFGPANLAIATAFADNNLKAQRDDAARLRKRMSVGFVEAHPEFRWHPGMMIEGSRMQISFLKDLATIRDPTSPYTFLNYLASQNRLVTFINRSTFAPTRREFSDYMAWVAAQVVDNAKLPGDVRTGVFVHFGERVDHIEAVADPTDASDVQILAVCSVAADGTRVTRYCRNLIISSGGVPSTPAIFRTSQLRENPAVIHTAYFLDRIDAALQMLPPLSGARHASPAGRSRSPHPPRRPTSHPLTPTLSQSSPQTPSDHPPEPSLAASLASALQLKQAEDTGIRIAVVGAGQSSAETFLEVRTRLARLIDQAGATLQARPQIDLIIRKGNLHPSDDSSFSNEIFDPQSTDFYYDLGDAKVTSTKKAREVVLEEAKGTNYSVVNPNTLEQLYEAMYEQRVEEDILKASQTAEDTHDPLLNDPKLRILRHTEVSCAAPSTGSRGLEVTLRSVLTGETSPARYDLIILGTGYTRQSWRDMLFQCDAPAWSTESVRFCDLFASNDACPPGCATCSEPASTGTVHRPTSTEEQTSSNGSSAAASPVALELSMTGGTSGPETPPSSGVRSSDHLSRHDEGKKPSPKPPLFAVARNYRLNLPRTCRLRGASGKSPRFRPTVWLQGSNEASHGISDSLLSVLSVRSAEVLQGIESEGWFGGERAS